MSSRVSRRVKYLVCLGIAVFSTCMVLHSIRNKIQIRNLERFRVHVANVTAPKTSRNIEKDRSAADVVVSKTKVLSAHSYGKINESVSETDNPKLSKKGTTQLNTEHSKSMIVIDHLFLNATGLVAPSGGITSLLEPSKTKVVPNVVHFVYFEAGRPFVFHQMVSVLSADRIIKPDVIKFHCDKEPTEKYWEFLKKNVSILEITNTSSSVKAGTKLLKNVENKSSVKRFQILQKEGGIYLDFDVIALKSFEPLRYYTMTMGIEYHGDPGRLNNGILLAAPGAKFLQKILDQYAKNYQNNEGDRHCCQIPYYLQFQYPHDIHVEEKTLNYPGGPKMNLIYNTVYDWSKNYAIHLWIRAKKWMAKDFHYSENSVKTQNTTFGQILRYVYYGSPDRIQT